jgi:2-dehydropantoate 2-reductase
MDFKYQKLLLNLGNALDVMVGPDPSANALLRQAQDEARAVYHKAGISTATRDEFSRRRAQLVDQPPAPAAAAYVGSSTWQSVARGKARIEVDYLNGEIVLQGRIHGVATPVNRFLMEAADRFARSGMPPGGLPAAQLIEAFETGRLPADGWPGHVRDRQEQTTER